MTYQDTFVQAFEDLPREIELEARACKVETENVMKAAQVRSFNHWVQHSFQHSPAFMHALPHPVTLATQVSLDRWQNVEDLLAAWGGPVSVCVYIPAPFGSVESRGALQGRFASYNSTFPFECTV